MTPIALCCTRQSRANGQTDKRTDGRTLPSTLSPSFAVDKNAMAFKRPSLQHWPNLENWLSKDGLHITPHIFMPILHLISKCFLASFADLVTWTPHPQYGRGKRCYFFSILSANLATWTKLFVSHCWVKNTFEVFQFYHISQTFWPIFEVGKWCGRGAKDTHISKSAIEAKRKPTWSVILCKRRDHLGECNLRPKGRVHWPILSLVGHLWCLTSCHFPL